MSPDEGPGLPVPAMGCAKGSWILLSFCTRAKFESSLPRRHADAPDEALPCREEDLHPIGFERMAENRVRNRKGQRSDSCKSGVRVLGRLLRGPAHLELRLRPIDPPISRDRLSLGVILTTEEASSGAKKPHVDQMRPSRVLG